MIEKEFGSEFRSEGNVGICRDAAWGGIDREEMMAPSLKPQNIGPTDWYYEYPTYILLVHECRSEVGALICTDEIKIPWRKLEESLQRRSTPRGAAGRE